MKITDPPLNSKRYPSSCQENYSLLTGPYTRIEREFLTIFSKWPFPGLFFISDNLQNINGRLYRDSNSDCQSIRHTRLPSDLHYSQKSSFTVNYLNGTLCVWASPLKFKKCFWFKSVRANGRMSEWLGAQSRKKHSRVFCAALLTTRPFHKIGHFLHCLMPSGSRTSCVCCNVCSHPLSLSISHSLLLLMILPVHKNMLIRSNWTSGLTPNWSLSKWIFFLQLERAIKRKKKFKIATSFVVVSLIN